MTKLNSRELSRRQFLGLAAGAALGTAFLDRYYALAAAELNRSKIRDVQVMLLQGGRTYTLIKITADNGLHGIAEAYGSPAWE